MKYLVALFLFTCISVTFSERYDNALVISLGSNHFRKIRDTSERAADLMARNILEWIQNIYQSQQNVRKTRQQADTAYLPPYSSQRPPEKPRPFQPATSQQPPYSPDLNEVTGGQRPSFSQYNPSNNGFSSSPTSTPRPSYTPNVQTGFSSTNGYPYTPRPSPPFTESSSVATSAPSGFPSSSTTYLPPSSGDYPSVNTRPVPSFSTPQQTVASASGSGASSRPIPLPGLGPAAEGAPVPAPGAKVGPAPGDVPKIGSELGSSAGRESIPNAVPDNEITPSGGSLEAGGAPSDDDLKHPPHIHNIEVKCSKTMMTINIEFNRAYDGIIYSKGFYMMPDCRYVEANSGNTRYTFTVNMDSCGTQFINDFEGEAGQAYLENVLVLQNEPGIQEVWDTVRRVRCLWEGNINKALTVSLSVDMLNQEIVTFSGDTATAKLDIQIGKGPFAPAADGLVKIGETMTLVVSVEGDPDFDLQVRDCVARDETSINVVQLTDERGCILKPKIFGAFQKTKDTGNTGASIIAYAFFQAFKFPDVMDLLIECNVELCKTNCEGCPEATQQIDPGRRRRSLTYASPLNSTANLASNAVRVGRGFRVVMPDDLSPLANQVIEHVSEDIVQEFVSTDNLCLSNTGFFIASFMILIVILFSTMSAVILYSKLQKLRKMKEYDVSQTS